MRSLLGYSFLIVVLFTTLLVTQTATAKEEAVEYITAVICRIIEFIFLIIIAIAVIICVLAGLRWLTSADDPAARAHARSMIIHAIAGALIAVAARFALPWILGAVTPFGPFTC